MAFLSKASNSGSFKSSREDNNHLRTSQLSRLMTETTIQVKVDKIKRKFSEFELVFSTHVLNLPKHVPKEALNLKKNKSLKAVSPRGMPPVDDNDDSFVSAERHNESMLGSDKQESPQAREE